MKTKSRKRCAINVARWASYAAAGAATAFAASNDAEGAILYSGQIDEVLNTAAKTARVTMLTLKSTSSFGTRKIGRMTHHLVTFPNLPGYHQGGFSAKAQPLAASASCRILGTKHNAVAFYASRLSAGALISAGQHFNTAAKVNHMALFSGTSGGNTASVHHVGPGSEEANAKWKANGTSFLGFEFNLGGGEQFGWAEVTMSGTHKHEMELDAYAYGTLGQAITAGEIVAPTPEPATLGLLAMGALGLLTARMAPKNGSQEQNN